MVEFQIADKNNIFSTEEIVFHPTQGYGDVNMKRFSQGPPDFTLNHIAGKVTHVISFNVVYVKFSSY